MYEPNQIRDLLLRNNKAVLRGVVAIYEKQLPDEKNYNQTLFRNNVGFNAYDAATLSKYARRIMQGHRLSDDEINLIRIRLLKYSKQLTKIANDKVEYAQLRWNV